jgi:light-regulated signal transduction histidine kinase (bacteriophytochrome)
VEGFSRALLEDYADRVDEEGRDYLNRIVGGAVRMDMLINDLLTYSRLGRRGAQFTGVDMNELVRLSLEDLGENIREAGAHVEVAADLPAVEGDRSMLLVLFDNIIGNAVKFRRPGVPPAVTVTARVDDGLCVFAVADNGIGLDPQYESKIFNIFQRLHTDDEYPGTGIGLASARKVVVAHGGRIWFESAPGQGATFYLELPRAPAHNEGRTDG